MFTPRDEKIWRTETAKNKYIHKKLNQWLNIYENMPLRAPTIDKKNKTEVHKYRGKLKQKC